MRELLILGGMVIGAFAVFVGVMTMIAYASTDRSSETNMVQKISELKTTFENSTDNPDKAYLVIVSLTTWQASIMDSGNDFTTIDGDGVGRLSLNVLEGLSVPILCLCKNGLKKEV